MTGSEGREARHCRCVLFFLLLMSGSACSAPESCDAEPSAFANRDLVSPSLTGSAQLSQPGESASFDLRAELKGLPELWPAGSAIASAVLRLDLSLRYADAPQGGDGRTEMPRLRVTLDRGLADYTSPAFPRGEETAVAVLFPGCQASDVQDCCPFGARECAQPVHAVLTRVDGAPFPPLQVSWSAQAEASVRSCPRALGTPALSLASEAP